ncbi:MAG: histidine--tRNA ligase [Phycisphaerae bacterium]|nr:histidine--tRNA ligase [Phycisphaerae bacterium]
MADSTRRFQAPKGTRDFYPEEMAFRRHIESTWRAVSIEHGFDEIEGPAFEHLDLYTVKSGEGIISELFSFTRAGGDVPYALRPEFTPTLARMYASRANSLPVPTKWFAIPTHFRAERPQRGRLREHVQWNIDMIGDPSANADAEVLATCIGVLDRFGLSARDMRVRLSHRDVITLALQNAGVQQPAMQATFELIDRREKMGQEAFQEQAMTIGLEASAIDRIEALARTTADASEDPCTILEAIGVGADAGEPLRQLQACLEAYGLLDWCTWDFSIVRGLAYYTGMVFEVHEATGSERAVAGGGRYDNLIELFGGPPTPACGFGMGDVVLGLVLKDRCGDSQVDSMPGPDAFVICDHDDESMLVQRILASLWKHRLHARRSYKSTRNVGKLLADADRCGARFTVLVSSDEPEGSVVLRDMQSKNQESISIDQLAGCIRSRLSATGD